MRSLSLLILTVASFLHTAEARASGCFLGAFVSADPAVNCQIVVHEYTAYGVAAPKLFVMRDGSLVDVTGTVDKQTTTLPVEYPETDCQGNVISTSTNDEAYDVYRVTINGGLVGEALFVNSEAAGHIAPAVASCVEPAAPQPVCGHLPVGCDYVNPPADDDGSGCNSGGAQSGVLALMGCTLFLSRRKRRCSN